MSEFNILIGDVTEEDKILFFGPILDSDVFYAESDSAQYPHVLSRFNFFPSNSAARKNGWGKEIPEGWSEHTIGKLKRKLYILKNTTGW